MIKHLDRLADRSVWISGERVNALVAMDAHGLAEIGFHGVQPVSRNSRMLVRPSGVLAIAVRDRDGEEFALNPASVDWQPYGIHAWAEVRGHTVHVTVVAGKRFLRIAAHHAGGGQMSLILRFSQESCFTEVRGERVWRQAEVRGGWLHLQCRDRIRLHDWIRRTGPYAGDFLIAEPWRRMLFGRAIRSGSATADDLLPEYRDLDAPLYDAETWIRMGGEGVVIESGTGEYKFVAPLTGIQRTGGEFYVEFSERAGTFEESGQLFIQSTCVLDSHEHLESTIPRFRLAGYPSLQQCLTAAPGIVRSATLQDLGMTRASPGAYYWIWAWDNLVVGQEMLRWGQTGTAGEMIRFINTHRDANDAIPARWTRSLLPLDTPPRGAFDFLLLHLAVQHAAESGELQGLVDVYPYGVRLLRERFSDGPEDGMCPNMSFYPDLPAAFGRSEKSVVALEAGALYGFARLMEHAALVMTDETTAGLSRRLAERILNNFLLRFWDDSRGFLCDAFDSESGKRNLTYPLFSLIFLQTPLSLPLLRPHLRRIADFLHAELLSPRGVRMVPQWDIRRGGEVALSSWYPHWDLYLLKILRRAGDHTGIVQWLQAAEDTVAHLGYVPEYLELDEGGTAGGDTSWLRHGAASNLNCLTGWYRAVLEGVYGLEFDPGGMTVIPLGLPPGLLEIRRIRHRGSPWHVRIQHRGPVVEELRIDGIRQRGCLKIPASTHDGAGHQLEVLYGNGPPGPYFAELVNAEMLESDGDERRARVLVRALGTMDISAMCGPAGALTVDGTPVPLLRYPGMPAGYAQLTLTGLHELTLTTTTPVSHTEPL